MESSMHTRLLFLGLGFLWGTALAAQDVSPLRSRTLVKISPQHVVVNTLQMGTEHFTSNFARSLAFDVGIRYHGQFLDTEDLIERGVDLGFQYRTYIRGLASVTTHRKRTIVQGIYAGPFVHGGMVRRRQITGFYSTYIGGVTPPRFEQRIDRNDFEEYFFATGFTVGVQRIFWNVLAVDVFAGGGMRWSQVQFLAPQQRPLNTDVITPGYQGIFPRIGFKIGVAL